MKSTKLWLALIAALALACLGGMLVIEHLRPPAVTAEIYQGGVLLRTVDLTEGRSYSFDVEAPNGGSNTVTVDNGRICISHATCPDQVCVLQGWVSDGVIPIVCLPNQLVIQIKGGEQDLDTATG